MFLYFFLKSATNRRRRIFVCLPPAVLQSLFLVETASEGFSKGKPLKGSVYVTSTDEDEMWPCLLEKAYAKFKGGAYSALIGGRTQHALADLTGAAADVTVGDLVDGLVCRVWVEGMRAGDDDVGHIRGGGSDVRHLPAGGPPASSIPGAPSWPPARSSPPACIYFP